MISLRNFWCCLTAVSTVVLCSFCVSAQDKGVVQPPKLPQQAESASGRHLALLISVQDYYQNNGLTPLKYCDRDMEKFEDNLHKFGFAEEDVVRMFDTAKEKTLHVTLTNVKKRLEELIQKSQGEHDILVIAYSGHGIQEKKQRYLCPPDTPGNYNISDLIALYDSDNQGLLNIVEKKFNGQCFVFLDACRTGKEESTETLYPKSKRIHIISACENGKPSYEDDSLQQGRFMYYVNHALDISDENVPLKFGKLFEDVENRMQNEKRFKNQPQKPVLRLRGETTSLFIGTKVPETWEQTVTSTPFLPDSRSKGNDNQSSYRSRFQQTSAEREFNQTVTDIVQLPSLYGEWWFQEMPWYLPVVRKALSNVLEGKRIKDDGKYGEDFLGRDIYAYLNTNTQEAKETLWKYVTSQECRNFLPQEMTQLLTDLKEFNNTQDQYAFTKASLEKLKKCFKNCDVPDGFYHTVAVFHHQLCELATDNETKTSEKKNAKDYYN
jgi:hypothetical protein